jgi:hypothetical protein
MTVAVVTQTVEPYATVEVFYNGKARGDREPSWAAGQPIEIKVEVKVDGVLTDALSTVSWYLYAPADGEGEDLIYDNAVEANPSTGVYTFTFDTFDFADARGEWGWLVTLQMGVNLQARMDGHFYLHRANSYSLTPGTYS